MNFPQQTVIDLCQKYGPQLHVSPEINGKKLMYATACNESSCGEDCLPRHEPAYDVGGSFYLSSPAIRALVDKVGHPAACSYGPWQVMYSNCQAFTPEELLEDPDAGAQAYVHFMNTYVLGAVKAVTLVQIAETYNSGNFRPNKSAGVLKYVADAQHHYLNAPISLA